jgi:class 3 adenylate cyclase
MISDSFCDYHCFRFSLTLISLSYLQFADIVGFTSWSSVREPSQVFTLLETLYAAFDAIARRRRIFKVETIGDCYVAVAGLPEPRIDHAIVMARFATDIMSQVHKMTRKLEVSYAYSFHFA